MEEAWELAAVNMRQPSEEFSSRHTRLRYQMLLGALLFFMAYRYGVDKLKIPGFFTFDQQPSEITLLIGIFLFFVFTLVSFLVQSVREFPKFANDFRSYGKFIKSNINFFDTTKVVENSPSYLMKQLRDAAKNSKSYTSESELLKATQDVAVKIESLLLSIKYKSTELDSYHEHMEAVFPSSENGWPSFKRLFSNIVISGNSFSEHFSRTYAAVDFDVLNLKSDRIVSEVIEFTNTYSSNFKEAKILNQGFESRLKSKKQLYLTHNSFLSFWVPFSASVFLILAAFVLGPETKNLIGCQTVGYNHDF